MIFFNFQDSSSFLVSINYWCYRLPKYVDIDGKIDVIHENICSIQLSMSLLNGVRALSSPIPSVCSFIDILRKLEMNEETWVNAIQVRITFEKLDFINEKRYWSQFLNSWLLTKTKISWGKYIIISTSSRILLK